MAGKDESALVPSWRDDGVELGDYLHAGGEKVSISLLTGLLSIGC